jgi:hypothetical protein
MAAAPPAARHAPPLALLHLDGSDDVVSVCDRLAWAGAPRALLALPEAGGPLCTELDLVRVRRCADRLRCEVGLLTADRQLARAARALGFPVFADAATAESRPRDWRRARRRTAIGVERLTAVDRAGHLFPPPVRALPRRAWLARLALALLLAALAGAAWLWAAPRATLVLQPETRLLRVALPATADLTPAQTVDRLYLALAAQTPRGFALVPQSLAVVRSGDQFTATAVAAAGLEVETVLTAVAGQEVDAAVAILRAELPLRAPPTFEVWPAWFKRVPFRPARLDVRIITDKNEH